IKDNDTGEILGSTIVDEDGKWTVKPDEPLDDGNHNIVVVEVDEAGNESDPSDVFEVVVDTVAPEKPTIGGVTDNTGDKTGPITSGEPTDEKQPEFSGEGEPGSEIIIKDNDTGEILGSTIVDEDGKWTVKPDQPLDDGNHNIVVVEVDEAGNESDPSDVFEVVVDTVAPEKPTIGGVTDNTGNVTGPINSGDPTDEKQPEFSGEGEPGSEIIIKDNDTGEILGSTIVDEDGKWTVKPDEPLGEGNHNIVVVEVDEAGNESDPSDVFEVVVDTTAPEKPTVGGVTDNTGSITGPINSGDVTDETRPEFSGTGEPGSTITIKDAETGEVLGTSTVDENGNWTVQPETDLGEGNHNLVVTETDKAGNESAPSDSFEVVVDTTAPEKPTVGGVYDNEGDITGMIKPGDETDDKTPTFTGEGEPGNTITVKDGDQVIGTAIIDENGAWSFTPETELSDGSHSITITETDKAGNESDPSDSFDFVVDTTPPNPANLSITGVMDNYGEITGNITNGGATDDSRPVISGTGTAGDTIILYVNDGTGNHEIGRGTVGTDGKWSIQPEAPLLPGSNQFTAVEMDPAGNKTDPSNQYTVTLDVSRPSEPVIVNVLDNAGDVVGPLQKGDVTDDNKPTITGTAEAGYTIRIYDGTTLLGTATADSKGVWAFTPDTALADGKHNITATATSPVGQTSDPTGIFNFEVDTKAPESVENLVVTDNVGDYQGPLSNGDTTDDNTPTFSGKAEAGSTVTIYADGKVLGSAKVDGEGKWTFTPDSALADGEYNFTTTVTDKAGNINPDGPGLSITIDTSNDPVSITALIDDVGSVTGNITANGVTDDTQPEITGEGKPGATIKVYDGSTLLGETTVKANGSWSFTPSTELKEGAHSITVTMTDKAGNLTGPTAAFDFTVDTIAPTVLTIDSAFDDVGSKQGSLTSGSSTDDSTPTLKGTAEKGSLVTIYDNGQFLGTATADDITGEWSFTPSTPINEGEHKFHVTATDAAGNESNPSADFVLTTDYTGPDASNLKITGVADNYGEITGNIENGKATDDSRPTIQGTGTAGDTIIVYAEDATGKHEIGSTTVGTDGKWSLQPESPLLPGENKFTAVEIDPVGNFTDPSAEYVVTLDMSRPTEPVIVNVLDNVGEVTGALQKGDVTDDTKPVITGTSEAGYLVRIYDGATLIGSTTANEKGVWTFEPTTALADGKHNITATATSPLGQTSNPTGIFNFEVDTKAPNSVENLQVFDNVGDKQGYILDGDTTDDNTPTFSGKAEAGSTVTIYDNGNAIGSAKVDNNGNWSFTPDSKLPDGEHTFSSTVTDKAGNTNTDGPSLTVTIDTSNVVVSISALIDNVGDKQGNITPNSSTDDTQPEITGEGKAGSTITIYDGSVKLGETTVKADGTWSFTPSTPLKEGSHSITVIAKDKAGNTSDRTSAFEFTVDTTAPTMPTIESALDDVGTKQGTLNNGDKTDDSTPTLTGTAEKGSVVNIYGNGALLGSTVADSTTGKWTFTPSTPVPEGENKFHVTATDAAGNESKPSADFVLTTDYTRPDLDSLKITEVIDNVGKVTGNVESGKETDDNRPTIKGEGTAGDTILVYVKDDMGERLLGSTTVGGDGKWSLRPDTVLNTGKNEFTAVEMDPVGNQVGPSAGYEIVLAGNPPQPPTIDRVEDNVGPTTGALQKGDVTDDNTPTLKGTAVANGTVTIYNNGNVIGSAKVDDKGNWSFTPEPALKDGTYNITADATNTIGQTSEKTGIFDFMVDTTAPSAVENLLISDNVGAYQGPLKDGDVTDDNTPTFNGKAEAGSTVSVYNDGTLLGTAKVGSDGNWSFTPSTPLPDGDYKFTTTVTDKAGNTGDVSPVVNITVNTEAVEVSLDKLIDDVGDITGPIAPNGVTDDARPEITGTGKAGSIIKIYDGATLLGSTTVNADKSWSFTPSTDLGQGKHSITVTATDQSNNTTDPTSAFEFTVDTQVPNQPTIESALDDVGAIQGNLTNGAATDDPTPTLTGKAEKGSIVKVYDGGALLGSVVADETTGQWTFTPTSPLIEGEHKFHVTATDAAGNVSLPSADFVLNMDFTAPDPDALKITEVIDNVGKVTGNVESGKETDDNRPTIKGEGTAGDTIFVYVKDDLGSRLLGSTTVDSNGKWSLRPDVVLNTGKNELTAVEMDPVGNKVGPSDAYEILLAGNPPQPPTIDRVEDNVGPTTGALQKGDVTDDATPTLKGTAVANGIVTIYNNGNVIGSAKVDEKGNWSFTPEPALKDGKYNITADATNTVGQTSDKTGIFDFTVDTTPPGAVESLLISDNVGAYQGPLKDGDTTDDNTPTFSGKAEAGGTVSIYNDGNLLGTAKVGTDGSWSFTPSTPLLDGDYKFTTTVTDKAGNTGDASPVVNITVNTDKVEVSLDKLIDDVGDITGPIAQNGVTDDTRPEITGTGKAGSIIKVYDGSTLLGSTTVNADKSWSFTPTTDLGQGKHSITVTATDTSGNTTDPTSAFEFTIDTAAPSVPTIESAKDDVGAIQGNLTNGMATDDPTPTLTGKAEKGSIVKVYDGNALLGSVVADETTGQWTFTPTSPLVEGEHKFHATSTDKAGNVSLPSADFVLNMDFTAPDPDALKITEVIDNVGKVTGNIESGKETDDNRPTIKGEGTAGDTIFVYVKDDLGDRLLGSTTVDSNGKWSLRPDVVLNTGKNELTAVEMDPVGNKVGPSDAYEILLAGNPPQPPTIDRVEDNVGPTTGALQKGDVTDDNTPTLKGTAVANGTVTIYNNGNVIGTAKVDDKGNWSFTPEPALTDGKYNITADATNTVGQTSEKTGIFDFTVDTTAPSAVENLLISDNVGAYQGPLSNGDTTDDSTPTFSGKAEAGGTVSIYNDGNLLGTAKVGTDGTWSFTPSSPLPDGDYKFTTTVTDKAGNTGDATPVVNITINTETVEVSLDKLIDDVGDITGPIAQNGVTDDVRPEITGTGKAGSIIKVYDGATLLGSTTVNADKSWSFTPTTDLSQGNHSITVTATDQSNNTTDPTSAFEFTIDTTAPSVPTIESAKDDVGAIQGNLTNGMATDDPTPTLTGKAEKGSIVKVYDGNALLGSVMADETTGQWTFTPTSPLVEGEHKFHVTSTDKAGNVSLPSADFVLNMDFTGPDPDALKITEVIDNVGKVTGNIESGKETDDNRPTINGEGTAGDTIFVYVKDDLGDRLLGSTTVDGNGKWSLRPDTALTTGKNEFTAVEMDPVGNKVGPSDSYDILLAGNPPQPPTIDRVEDNVGPTTGALQKGDVTDDNTPTLKGTAVANGTVTIYNNGNVIGTAKVDDKGNWSFTPEPALKDGTYNITADATNTVGQTSDKTGVFDFTVDTTPPGTVESLLISDNVGAYQGPLKDGDTTDDSTPTFSGKAEAGGTVSIYNDGNLLGTAKVGTDGTWSFTPSTPLPDGNYKFTTTVTDKAGNTGDASPVVNITVNTDTVEVSLDKLIDDVGDITGPIAQNGVTDDTRPEITGTGKAGSIIKVYDGATLLGSTTVNADKSWSFTPTTDLGQGKHSITVTATDTSGNTTDPTSAFEFTIDTVAPTQPTIESAKDDVGAIQGTLTNGMATDDPTPTLTGKAEKGSIVKVYDGNTLLGSVVADETSGQWTFTPTSPLVEGEHKFHVTSTDKAGNVSLPSADFVLNMDFTGPDPDALKITGVDDQVGAVTGNVKPGDTTDDNRPTIQGEGTAGDTILVYVKDDMGDRLLGSTTVDINGKWTLRPSTALSSGKNEFTAVEMDPVGNKAGPSDAYDIVLAGTPPQPPTIDRVEDNVGPNTGALQKGDVTDDNTPTLKGTAVPNGTVTIYNNDVKIGTAKVDDKGNWSFTPEPALNDGTYNITADATNTVGQTSDKTGIFDFTVDTTPPGAVENLLISDNVGAYQGPLKDGDTTDDNTPTFSGKAEAGGTVSIYNDGNLLGTAKVGADGSWSFTPSTPLLDGDYKFTATVTDKAGNIGNASPVVNITIDTQGIEVSLDALIDDVGDITGPIAQNGVTDDTRPEIVGSGKAGSIIKIYDGSTLLGSTTVNADKSWSFTPTTDLGQGKHSITVTATDLSGNTSDSTSAFEFTIDTVAPTQPTIESAKDDVGSVQGTLTNGMATDDPTPTLTGKAEKGSIVKVYDGNTLLGSVVADETSGQWTFTPTSPLVEGEHKFHVTATDKAGNVSMPSADFVLEMDFTGPDPDKLKITGVDDQVGSVTGNVDDGEFTDDSRPTISGTGTAGDTIYVHVSHASGADVLLGTAKVNDQGTWTFRPENALAEGSNKFTAYERDPVGNEVGPSNSYTVTLDGSPVVIPTLDAVIDDVGTITGELKSGDVTDDTKPTFEGSASAGSTIHVYDGSTLLGTAKADGSGKWTFEPPTALKDGTHNITFTATSPIGQVSDPSDVFVVEVDTKVPSPVESLLITDNVGDYQGELKNGDTTDDSTPTFSGKAEAGSIVTIYNDGVAIGSAKVSEGGTWTFTPETELPDGNYKFTTTVTDKAGNVGDATPVVNITIDTDTLSVAISKLIDDAGAVTGDILANGVTDDLRPEIVGTVSKPGSIITVYIDGVNQGTATANAEGKWSFTPTTDLGQGEHKVTVTAKDPTGNVTDMSPEFIFTIDNIPPALPTIEKAVDDFGDITGDIKSGAFTDDNTPTLHGTAEKDSIITIYDENDKALGSVLVNDQGKWVFELPAQADGRHDYYAIASDAAGNKSTPTPDFTLNIDTQGPVGDNLKVDKVIDNVGNITGELVNGGGTDDSRPEFKGTANEVGNTIVIYATDESGTTREVGRTTVDVNREWSHELANALADGSYKFTVVEMDAAGNKTNPTPEFELLIDTTIPTATTTISNMTDDVGPIKGDLPSGSYTDDSTPRLNGYITGVLSANDKVVIYEKASNGVLTALGEATMIDNTRWQFDIPPGSLVGGNKHTYVAAVTNKVGTTSTPSSDFVMTSVVEINSDTTLDTTPIISGRIPYALELGSYMEVVVNGKLYNSLTGAVVVDTVNLTWYVQIPDSDKLPVGTYDVVARINSTMGGTHDYSSNELVIAPTPPVIIEVDGVDGNNKATAFSMNEKGGWQLFTNQAVLNSTASSNSTIGEFGDKVYLTPNTGGSGYGRDNMNLVQNATFVDYDRDGDMDIFGIDSRWSNGQQMFINNGNGNYTAVQLDGLANSYSWYGGIAAIDLEGDGYVDLLNGDQTPNDAGIGTSRPGFDSQILHNRGDGTFIKDDWYIDTHNASSPSASNTRGGNATFGKELSGIDLNNDGAVDIVFHGELGSSKVGQANGTGLPTSSNQYKLVVATSEGNGRVNTSQIIENVFFNQWNDPDVANSTSMTWADYNGDGYMDLFLGTNMGTYTTAEARNSRIYFNDGNGKLIMDDPNNDGIGALKAGSYYQFNDNMLGGASVAVDWNGDGKMDIIEAPMIGINAYTYDTIGGSINLYTNTTSGSNVNFTTTYLQNGGGINQFGLDSASRLHYKGSISGAGVVTNNPVTGMVSADLNYDGVKDLLIFTSKGETTYVENKNTIAHGTSLHLRIVDAQGLTVFYGNTVQLVDSSGKVVSSQVINLQSGNQTNDSSSLVDFYGLNPNETYSVVLLRNVNGASQDVGGVSQVGTNTIENVNLGWANIKAGAANEALVLTAESGSNSANTIGAGVVGTGYNDTFIATQGTKTYEGGGGTTEMSNYKTWTDTGGVDIVDFKLAGNTDLTINMMNQNAQYTGWNTVTLKNIEGIAGGAGNDTFTDDAGDNVFEGRAGNDTFNLLNGGRDTLLYKPQVGSNGDNRGGNGSDVVNGFTLGAWEATPNADRIDVSEMLTGYTFGGGAKWINGVATMEPGESIANYLKVVISGSDTLIYIDRDGNGGAYGSELLVTLKDVQTDLLTLLANHQLEVDNSDVSASATVSEFQAITQMFTAGNDIMFGTEHEDILLGGLGDDTFIGIGKGDQVSGGDGNDLINIISTDFASISGDAGIDTLVLDMKGELLDLSALKDKLSSVEIFDMGNGGNTMNVSLEDVLRLGSEELAINSGNKAIVVNGEAGSTLQLDGADGQWTMSQSNYQYQGNTYNVWTSGTSGIEVLVENTVNPVIL
ncbi:Ig-like domain repeat protein, partial [Budviciaceae bacterium CWB-B4]|nr:Ig-like domain repeat protein [Limnobaculum xujianqingii]